MLRQTAFMAAIHLLLGLEIAQAEQQLHHVTLSIPNMECVSCEMQVEQAISEVDGVSSIEFDGEAKTVSLHFDGSQESLEKILASCAEAGYPATVLESVRI